MTRINKNDYYMNIAHAVSLRSTCLKRRYGCVIVQNDEIIATGYNGSPRGQANCCDIYEKCPRMHIKSNSGNYDNCHSVHAEQNALLAAKRSETIGATLYLAGEMYCPETDSWEPIPNCEPCPICMKMIQNAGISKIIGFYSGYDIYLELDEKIAEIFSLYKTKTLQTLYNEYGFKRNDFILSKEWHHTIHNHHLIFEMRMYTSVNANETPITTLTIICDNEVIYESDKIDTLPYEDSIFDKTTNQSYHIHLKG